MKVMTARRSFDSTLGFWRAVLSLATRGVLVRPRATRMPKTIALDLSSSTPWTVTAEEVRDHLLVEALASRHNAQMLL